MISKNFIMIFKLMYMKSGSGFKCCYLSYGYVNKRIVLLSSNRIKDKGSYIKSAID